VNIPLRETPVDIIINSYILYCTIELQRWSIHFLKSHFANLFDIIFLSVCLSVKKRKKKNVVSTLKSKYMSCLKMLRLVNLKREVLLSNNLDI